MFYGILGNPTFYIGVLTIIYFIIYAIINKSTIDFEIKENSWSRNIERVWHSETRIKNETENKTGSKNGGILDRLATDSFKPKSQFEKQETRIAQAKKYRSALHKVASIGGQIILELLSLSFSDAIKYPYIRDNLPRFMFMDTNNAVTKNEVVDYEYHDMAASFGGVFKIIRDQVPGFEKLLNLSPFSFSIDDEQEQQIKKGLEKEEFTEKDFISIFSNFVIHTTNDENEASPHTSHSVLVAKLKDDSYKIENSEHEDKELGPEMRVRKRDLNEINNLFATWQRKSYKEINPRELNSAGQREAFPVPWVYDHEMPNHTEMQNLPADENSITAEEKAKMETFKDKFKMAPDESFADQIQMLHFSDPSLAMPRQFYDLGTTAIDMNFSKREQLEFSLIAMLATLAMKALNKMSSKSGLNNLYYGF